MSNLESLADLPLLEIWGDTVRARRVEGGQQPDGQAGGADAGHARRPTRPW